MSNHVIMFLHAQKYAAVRRAPLQKVSCQCCEILTRNASPACNSNVIRRNRHGQKDPLLHQVIQVAMDLSVISFISACISKLLWSPPCESAISCQNFTQNLESLMVTWCSMIVWCSLMQLDAPLEHKVHRLCPSSHRFHVKPAQRWPKDPFQDKHSMKMEYWVHCYTATHWHADNRPAHAIQEPFHPWCHGSRTSSHRGMEASRQASRRTDITRMV